MNGLIFFVLDCMRVRICERGVGLDSHVYVDIGSWDQVVEFKLVWVAKDLEVFRLEHISSGGEWNLVAGRLCSKVWFSIRFI